VTAERVPGLARPKAFADAGAFRSWLERHHASKVELIVRCSKVGSTPAGLTYLQALDEALCFGWIDGVRRGLDASSFSVRFTPRRPKSAWSAINIARARQLIKAGRMRAVGLGAFRERLEARRPSAPRTNALPRSFRDELRAHPRARRFFEAQPPWYRRLVALWVSSAKKPETQKRRFAVLVECSEQGRPVPPLARPTTSK
jgi:uncharacterized protein YdeI (YjbR/CyaY-like superfamily)